MTKVLTFKYMYKIGIFGSDERSEGDPLLDRQGNVYKFAKEFGEELSKLKATIITGACSGIPYSVAYEAHRHGCDVIGYSPEPDINGQKLFTPKDDLTIYKEIKFTPKSFEFASNRQVCKKYRNVISTANCDAGIIISGRWGTMNEFTNLYDMGKVIGVLIGTGGIADELPSLSKKINKKSRAKVLFDSSPKILIQKTYFYLKSNV